MKYKKRKEVVVETSSCCNYEVRYNGFVGLTCYGYTCNKCDRKCNVTRKLKTIWTY